MNYSIQADNILYNHQLIQGYICIKGERIKHVYQGEHLKPLKYPVQYQYTHQIVMPAGIDTNVSLTMWDHITEFSKLALIGGISLVVNKSFYFQKQDLQQTYDSQVQLLLAKSQTDFIQLMQLTDDQIIKTNYYQVDLMPSYAPTYCKQLPQIIKELPPQAVLFCHMQNAIEKDLQITSPFRKHDFTDRLGTSDLVDADGVQGDYNSDDDNLHNHQDPHVQNQMDYLNEETSPMKDVIHHYKGSLQVEQINQFPELANEPQSPLLHENVFKFKSKQITEYSEMQLISRAELITYPEQPKMEQSYQFPAVEQPNNQDEQDSPSSDSHSRNSPQMSIQSSESSSPGSMNFKSRNRTRSNTQTLLQRRQSKTGFALVLHQVDNNENGNKHGSGDLILQNFSESRPRRKKEQQNSFNKDYLCFLAFRPATWERFAISHIKKCIKQQFQCKLVLKGFSSAFALVQIKGLLNNQIYSDLSYPHLLFDTDDIEDGQTQFKSDPPIRQKFNKHLLQKAICQDKWVSSVSSQHFYVNTIYKFHEEGDFRKAVSGVCSLGCNFQTVWSVLFCRKSIQHKILKEAFETKKMNDFNYQRFLHKLNQLQQLMSTGAAEYLNLKDRGEIKENYIADLVVFDPFKPWKLNFDKISSDFTFSIDKHIFKNKLLLGRVEHVYIRGQLIMEKKKLHTRQAVHIQ